MRVLLVEDDPTISKSIELMLKSESFNVYTTDLGEEGVGQPLLEANHPAARRQAIEAAVQVVFQGVGRQHENRHLAANLGGLPFDLGIHVRDACTGGARRRVALDELEAAVDYLIQHSS